MATSSRTRLPLGKIILTLGTAPPHFAPRTAHPHLNVPVIHYTPRQAQVGLFTVGVFQDVAWASGASTP